MDKIGEGVVTVFTAIIGVAILALLVSPKATTANVIQATASGFGNDLGVAESPVTGDTYQINLAYPSSSPMNVGTPSFGDMPSFA